MASEKLLEIGAAFDCYKESGGPPKADPDLYLPVIEHLKSVKPADLIPLDRPVINNFIPDASQWNTILNYYYSIHDRIDKTEPDIDMLAELEVWFIKFIEPRPSRTKKMGLRMDLWKDRELAKYKLMVSDYCPSAYREQISKHNIESSPIPADWLHIRINKIEEMYRTTPQTILKKSKGGKTVTRTDGGSGSGAKGGNVVNLNKILGRS